jgi:hypothetical protein
MLAPINCPYFRIGKHCPFLQSFVLGNDLLSHNKMLNNSKFLKELNCEEKIAKKRIQLPREQRQKGLIEHTLQIVFNSLLTVC